MSSSCWKQYENVPITTLRNQTKKVLYMELNAPAPIRNKEGLYPDYRGLSSIINLYHELLPDVKNSKNPAKALFDHWSVRQDSTVQNLFIHLEKLDRCDIIYDILSHVDKDLHRSDNEWNLKIKEDGEMYDVFVSYCDEDFTFVRDWCIPELEDKLGMKLFIPDRDMYQLGVQHEITAQLIEDKCNKTLVIFTDEYLKSPQCQFQIRYAMALPQDAGISKIVPIILKPCKEIPRMLNFMTRIDYTREELRPWFWPRLATTIKHKSNAPTAPYRADLSTISLPTNPRPKI